MKKIIVLIILVIVMVSAIIILKKPENPNLKENSIELTNLSEKTGFTLTNKVVVRKTYTNKWQSREYLFDIMHSLSNQYPDVEYSADLEETVQLLIDAIPNKKPFILIETVTYSQITNIILHVYPDSLSYTLRSKKYEYLKKNIFTNGVSTVPLTYLIDKLVEDKQTLRFDLRFKSLVPHIMNKILELHRSNPDLACTYKGVLNSHYYPDAKIGAFIINKIIPKTSPSLTFGDRGPYSMIPMFAFGGKANPDCLPLIITILNNPDKFTAAEWRYAGVSSLSQYTNDIVVSEAQKSYKVLENRKKYWKDPLILRYFSNDYNRGYDAWMKKRTKNQRNKSKRSNPPVYDEEPWRCKL